MSSKISASSLLRKEFPLIRTKKQLLQHIQKTPRLNDTFQNWTSGQQEQFVSFCTGVRGIKMLYDSFFKEILNPETAPERLNELLSLSLKQRVTVVEVLPNDSVRLGNESALLITDMIVKLEDGSLANLEVQKIGYLFPGPRAACYGADMLLRQYKAVRSRLKKKFSYKDVKNVYCMIFYEQSPGEFHAFPDTYLHSFSQKSDTGLSLDLLMHFCFVSLDIFLKMQQNRGIKNRLEAWLAFLGSDDPEVILELIRKYPDFKAMYQQAYAMCRNVEDVMGFFSEELRIMDRNTELYMIDQMQEMIKQKEDILLEKDNAIRTMDNAIRAKDNAIRAKDNAIRAKDNAIREQEDALRKALDRIAELEREKASLERRADIPEE